MDYLSSSLEETRALGARIAVHVRPGDLLALIGDLGAGKTEFVRGFVDALSPGAPVRSPTFTLLNVYETPVLPVYHFDFYRLCDPGELVEIGLDDYLEGSGVCLIEWADLFMGKLPAQNRHEVRFADTGLTSRRVQVSSRLAARMGC